MRVHILGICGTFMAGIAVIAKQCGYEVVGSDENVYPPMSTQLITQGIKLYSGYDSRDIDPTIDYVIVGNVIKRGNPAMEFVLRENIPYMSGPEWLAKHILQNRTVLAVSGTHGKTTTTSILSWILEFCGKKPGFLIGGVPENFAISARLGEAPFFVIEADEYDSAFFDKRSKFIHYHPKVLILNNLEFDHADIFPNLDAIKQQFHYLVRTVPDNGLIVKNALDENLTDVLAKGCWTPVVTFGTAGEWHAELIAADGSHFRVYHQARPVDEVHWDLLGPHNVSNALAALAAATQVGVNKEEACKALSTFKNVKRRLEVKGVVAGITIYDDFAHHPTAITTTLAGLRAKVGKKRIIAVLEFGSYTMRTGVHQATIQASLNDADFVFCQQPKDCQWDVAAMLAGFSKPAHLYPTVEILIDNLVQHLRPDDHVIVMSNSGFGGIHQKLLQAIEVNYGTTAIK